MKFTVLILLGAMSALTHAASFDCTKAASATEKLICSNPAVSQLDEQLGQAYKQALTNANDKDALKQQQMEWLKQQRACKDADCLTQTYQARIAQLQNANTPAVASNAEKTNSSNKKVVFKMTENAGPEGLCEEYLKVLNRTVWDDLLACKLPDLTGSPIQPVTFTPVTGDDLKVIDKLIYEHAEHRTTWDADWPVREKEYAIGYRKIGEAYWDLDEDGKPDHIIEYQEPSATLCEILPKGKEDLESKKIKTKWDAMSIEEKTVSGNTYGFRSDYFFVTKNELFFVDAEKYVYFGNKKYSISQRLLTSKNTGEVKIKLEVWGVKPIHDQHMKFNMTPTMCQFVL